MNVPRPRLRALSFARVRAAAIALLLAVMSVFAAADAAHAAAIQPYQINHTVNPLTGVVTVTGKADPGNDIEITFPDGQVATGVVLADGTFRVSSAADVTSSGFISTVSSDGSVRSRPHVNTYDDTVVTVPLAIRYDLGGGTGPQPDDYLYSLAGAGAYAQVLPDSSELTRPGYTFDAWYGLADGQQNVRLSNQVWLAGPDDVTEFFADLNRYGYTVTAHWTITTVTLDYDPNGAAGTVDSEAVDYDTEVTIADAASLTREGFDFVGWHDESTDVTYQPGESLRLTADTSLTALWQQTPVETVAPTITDPADQSVVADEAAVFEVAVTGVPDPTVVWEFSTDGGASWSAIADDAAAVVSADGLVVTVTPASAGHSGYQYRATASNSVDAVTSAAATLTVTEVTIPEEKQAPSVTNPADQTVVEGASAKFEVTVNGTPAPTVVWEVSTDGGVTWGPALAPTAAAPTAAAPLPASVTTFDVSAAALSASGSLYRVTATNSEGSATSAAAKLTVTQSEGAKKIDTRIATTGAASQWTTVVAGLLLAGGALLAGGHLLARRRA